MDFEDDRVTLEKMETPVHEALLVHLVRLD